MPYSKLLWMAAALGCTFLLVIAALQIAGLDERLFVSNYHQSWWPLATSGFALAASRTGIMMHRRRLERRRQLG